MLAWLEHTYLHTQPEEGPMGQMLYNPVYSVIIKFQSNFWMINLYIELYEHNMGIQTWSGLL